MSHNHDRKFHYVCQRKRRFSDKIDAVACAVRFFNRTREKRRVYLCDDCGYYHLTSHLAPRPKRQISLRDAMKLRELRRHQDRDTRAYTLTPKGH